MRWLSLLLLAQFCCVDVAGAQDKPKLTWGYVNPSSFYWDVYAALDLGFMERAGVTVEAINIPSAGQGAQLLLSAGVDVLSSNVEVAMSAIDNGANIALVGGELARAAFALTARPEIKDYADLRGKTLGVTSYTEASTTMLKLLLKKHGLGEGSFDMVTAGGTPNRLAALLSGAISATMLGQPSDFKAQAQGMRVLGYAFEAFDGPVVAFAVRKEWAQRNRPALVSFLRGAADASTWLRDPAHRARAISILRKYVNTTEDEAEKNYDLWFGQPPMMASSLELPDSGLQAYLTLRGTKATPGKYIDRSYAEEASRR